VLLLLLLLLLLTMVSDVISLGCCGGANASKRNLSILRW
jgi:hypothetical protein